MCWVVAIKVKGMQELTDTLDMMLKVGDKTAKSSLAKAGDYVKKKEVSTAKRVHGTGNGKGYSEDVGWKEIKRYPVKIGKKGGKFVNIGFRASVSGKQRKKEESDSKAGVKRATHWDKIKGLWFNHYGFYHNRTGQYVAGSQWMDSAFDDSVDGAFRIIREDIERGLGL